MEYRGGNSSKACISVPVNRNVFFINLLIEILFKLTWRCIGHHYNIFFNFLNYYYEQKTNKLFQNVHWYPGIP